MKNEERIKELLDKDYGDPIWDIPLPYGLSEEFAYCLHKRGLIAPPMKTGVLGRDEVVELLKAYKEGYSDEEWLAGFLMYECSKNAIEPKFNVGQEVWLKQRKGVVKSKIVEIRIVYWVEDDSENQMHEAPTDCIFAAKDEAAKGGA